MSTNSFPISGVNKFRKLIGSRGPIAVALSVMVLLVAPFSAWAQLPCPAFASGPFINVQNPPCGASCGTPVMPGFQVFGNEAYLFNTVEGSQYTVDFCNGYSGSTWPAGITVALSDGAGGVVPGSSIAWTAGCSLTFTAPTTDTYDIIISILDDCGGANLPVDNGFISVDCGPSGASCFAPPPPPPCELFASGPFINIQTPPCEASCGTPVMPGFQVFGNEAYLINTVAGSEYTVDFCSGYSAGTWPAVITVALSDDAGGAVPGSAIAWAEGCNLTFTAPTTDTFVITISIFEDCGGANLPTDNGFLSLDCGPRDALCSNPDGIFIDGFENNNSFSWDGFVTRPESCHQPAELPSSIRVPASVR